MQDIVPRVAPVRRRSRSRSTSRSPNHSTSRQAVARSARSPAASTPSTRCSRTASSWTGLLFIHGMDIPLEETDFRARVSKELVAAAADIGLPLLQVETNVRAADQPLCELGEEGARCDPLERRDPARRTLRHLFHTWFPPPEHRARAGLGLARPHRPTELDRLSLGRARRRRRHPAQQDGSDRRVRDRAAIPAGVLLVADRSSTAVPARSVAGRSWTWTWSVSPTPSGSSPSVCRSRTYWRSSRSQRPVR